MMGTALCVPLADRDHDVRLIGTPLDAAVVSTLVASHIHPGLGCAVPATIRVFPSGQLHAACADADAIVLGVSSAGLAWAAEALAPELARTPRPVAMVTKGLELDDVGVHVLSDAFARAVQTRAPGCAPVAVCGPCIAGELARRVPTAVVLTGRQPQLVSAFQAWLETPYYHPQRSPDVIGVQVCAALKNAYAMGVGLGAGLHERAGGERGSVAMHNLEAALFARSILEMCRVVAALGGDPSSAWGLPGSGDLTVTCNGGRTGRFGALLGRGHRAREARAMMGGVTLECLDVLAVLERALATRRLGTLASVDLPLLSSLVDLALHDGELVIELSRLFSA
jgi:glycerol-3-phosphate dehydrogenase (NAD(P)+)